MNIVYSMSMCIPGWLLDSSLT